MDKVRKPSKSENIYFIISSHALKTTFYENIA
jgi:hypothetical protein